MMQRTALVVLWFSCAVAARSVFAAPHEWPSNLNMTLYMLDSNGWYHKHIEYRFPTRQMRLTMLSSKDPRARDCVVLFDHNNTIWEWYTGEKRCAKLWDGIPMMSPNWMNQANMVQDLGVQRVTNPLTNTSHSCHKWCAPATAIGSPCYCETQLPSLPTVFIPVEHTHSSHNDTPPNGVSHYEDVILTPNMLGTLQKPHYCPPDHSPPLFQPTFGDLDKLCLRQWF